MGKGREQSKTKWTSQLAISGTVSVYAVAGDITICGSENTLLSVLDR